jgi:hypothetical protein
VPSNRYGGALLCLLLSPLVLTSPAAGQADAPAGAGTCTPGEVTADLDVNNVRARLFNTGQLFWRGSGNVYTVSKDGEANVLFAAGIWIGGHDADGEVRFVGTEYGPFAFWPGPLDAQGNPPADCAPYDRLYKISRADLDAYAQTGVAPPDLR